MNIEEIARPGPSSSGSPDMIHKIFQKVLSGNISITSRTIALKIRTLYQENITLEEVARQDPPSCGSPDTEIFRKNFEQEYLDNQQGYLAEYSNIVSGKYNLLGGGTTTLPSSGFPDT